MSALRFSYDHRTAWRFAYNVSRGSEHLGLVYRGSDDRWHAIAPSGLCHGCWSRRKDAADYLATLR